jgi:hypothetical protein
MLKDWHGFEREISEGRSRFFREVRIDWEREALSSQSMNK